MNSNAQILPIEQKTDGETLAIKSIWPTIQGDGPHAGWPAIFVRLGGCNLACWWCDVAYAVHEDEKPWNTADVLAKISTYRMPVAWPLVVITGGEPFRQNIMPLVAQLLGQGFLVQIETSGSAYQDLRGWWGHPLLTIVCSPKLTKIHAKIEPHIDAYKYILRADEVSIGDGLPITSTQTVGESEEVARPKRPWVPIYVSPLDEGEVEANAANAKACAEVAIGFGYRVSLQMHKILGVP